MKTDMPGATLVIVAYNQERFVGDAVLAALRQNHAPLQIVLSDDGSTDGTFRIMQDLAASYQGPHEVVLNRNPRNLGVSGHLNAVYGLAAGDIVVLGAGDDIACPDRVTRVVAEFRRDPRVRAVLTGYTEIDDEGRELRTVTLPPHFDCYTSLAAALKFGGWVGMDATFAYHRDCLSWPAPLPTSIICEDRLLPVRAALLGRIAYIPQPTVRYRVHTTSLSAGTSFKTPEYERIHAAVLAEEIRFALAAGLIDERTCARSLRLLRQSQTYLARIWKLSGARSPAARLGTRLLYHHYRRDLLLPLIYRKLIAPVLYGLAGTRS